MVRYQQPAGFAEVQLSTSDIWWEDAAGSEHMELWLVRAPADVSQYFVPVQVVQSCNAQICQDVHLVQSCIILCN